MSLDDFFRGSKEAWEKELKRKAEDAKALEEAERRRKIDAIKTRRGKGKNEPATAPAPATPPAAPPIVLSGNFKIESLADRYRIHQVQYQNNFYVVDWSKELLDDGKKHTQQEWITLTQSAEWKVPDMQLYHATLAALYRQRKHPEKEQKKLVQEMQQLFKTDFDPAKLYMMTSTRIKYAASGADEVTHEWGYASARKQSLSLVGPDTWINPSSGLEEQMNTLLGSSNLGEIENVYEWISGKKPYLWRMNSAPAQDEERAAVLGSSGQFIIDCNYDFDRSSRGVVASSSSRAEK